MLTTLATLTMIIAPAPLTQAQTISGEHQRKAELVADRAMAYIESRDRKSVV